MLLGEGCGVRMHVQSGGGSGPFLPGLAKTTVECREPLCTYWTPWVL